MKKLFLLGLILIIVSACTVAWADDTSYREYPQSGNVFPMNNDAIQMVSEEVTFADNQFVTVFIFKNTTPISQLVLMGFPFVGDFVAKGAVDPDAKSEFDKLSLSEKRRIQLNNIRDYYRFRSFVNGIETERKLVEVTPDKTNSNYPYAFVTKLTFSPNETINVTNIYHQAPFQHASAVGFNRNTLEYIFKSGASWAKTIEQANFCFYLSKSESWFQKWYEYGANEYQSTGDYAGTFRHYYLEPNIPLTQLEEDQYNFICHWNFKNIKPTQNITVQWGVNINDLDLQLPSFIYDAIVSKNVKSIAAKYPGFIKEMQNPQVFADYTTALSDCKIANGFKDKMKVRSRLLINFMYALKGYKFTTPEWSEFFQRFGWYHPVSGTPVFSGDETKRISALMKTEAMEVK